MTTEITNISQLLVRIEESNPDWPSVRPGTILMKNRVDSYYNFYKVLRLEVDSESEREFPENIVVYYSKSLDGEKWYDHDTSSGGTTLYHSYRLPYFVQEYVEKMRIFTQEELDGYLNISTQVISGEISIESFNTSGFNENDEGPGTAIMNKNSKASLEIISNELEKSKNKVELIKQFVGLKLEEKKRELSKIQQKLEGVIVQFQKQMAKIHKVITVIELYLGVEEEIVQIREGEKAPKEEPINFRQLILYMDEEIAVYEDGGLDYSDIHKFDEWISEPKNLHQMLPEKKGMVVFKPRRYDKNYGGDIYYSNSRNQANHTHTYVLIRNGDNLYRIYTEKIVMSQLTFPTRKELQEMFDSIQNAKDYEREGIEEKANDKFYTYRKFATLIQGLLDRTEIFQPLPFEKLSVFNLEQNEGAINFIYDGEMQLPSGKQLFHEWSRERNSLLDVGSRVVVSWDIHGSEYKRRFARYYEHDYSIPSGPSRGLYTIEWGEKAAEERVPLKYLESWKQQKLSSGFARGIVERSRSISKYNVSINPLDKDDWYSGGIYRKTWRNPETNRTEDWPEEEMDVIMVDYVEKFWCLMYNPGDTIYNSWDWREEPHQRKNRLSFRVKSEDNFLINYDQLDLDDIDFYLTSRVDRHNYLSMIPTLKELQKARLKELENEKLFVQLVLDNFIRENKPVSEEIVWESVDWWKHKNKWKRPIDKDDSKAFRMIVSNIKSLKK